MMKRRRPWNAINEQVYSVASVDSTGRLTMNIATYVVPITMDIKRYMVAMYRNTQTNKNLYETNQPFLLQALTTAQAPLVTYLGRKSGITTNKERYLKQRYALGTHNGVGYLPNAYFVLALHPEQYIPVGDHDLIIARVETVVQYVGGEALTTYYLQEQGLVR